MFTCYPKYNINLGDKDFDNSLSLYFKFLRNDFMKEGNNVMTMNYSTLITVCFFSKYLSIDFCTNDFIVISLIFLYLDFKFYLNYYKIFHLDILLDYRLLEYHYCHLLDLNLK